MEPKNKSKKDVWVSLESEPKSFLCYGELSRIANPEHPTPLREIKLDGEKVFAKDERVNPISNSIKDRAAYYMLKCAIEEGLLTKEMTVVEPSSGNTGIAISGLVKKLELKGAWIPLPDVAPKEKIKMIKQYGGKVFLCEDGLCPKIPTEKKLGSDGAISLAKSMVRARPETHYMPNQYENITNVLAHYESTGPEIWDQKREVTHFVAGIGTGGTIMGVGEYLKEKNENIQIIGVMPEENHQIPGLKNIKESVKPLILDTDKLDRLLIVSDEDAYRTAFKLHEIGILIGPSSGANVWAAIQIAKEYDGAYVATILPDGAEKYGDYFEKFKHLKV